MITKKIYILLCCQIFPLFKTVFLIKAIFIQGAFKNIQGLFKGIPQISNFKGFSRTFQGLCKLCKIHGLNFKFII